MSLNVITNCYKCFELHEKVKCTFITSITNTKSFGIVKIDGNMCSRKCSCIKVYSLLAMRCQILHSHRGVWHCVSAKRIFTYLLMHRHNCSASWFKIFNRTSTTESMGNFFLLNLRKTPGIRANAALRFVSWNTYYVASLKIALIQESDMAVALIQWLVYFCESFSSLEIELMKVPSVFFPMGT